MPRMKTKLRKDDVVPVIRLVRTFRGGGFQIPQGEKEQDVPTGAITTVTALMTSDAVRSTRPEERAAPRRVSAAQGPKRRTLRAVLRPCHGEDGRSGPVRSDVPSAPDFTSVDWHRRRSDQQLKISILEGRGSRMPAFHGKLGDDQVGDIVAFLRSFAPDASDSRSVAQAELELASFDERFRGLQGRLDELRKQYYELDKAPATELSSVSSQSVQHADAAQAAREAAKAAATEVEIPGTVASGERFRRDCAKCHGADGTGQRSAPPLARDPRLHRPRLAGAAGRCAARRQHPRRQGGGDAARRRRCERGAGARPGGLRSHLRPARGGRGARGDRSLGLDRWMEDRPRPGSCPAMRR